MKSPPRGSAWRLALLGLMLGACGSSSDAARTTPGTPISAADFPALAADAYCKSIAHCCTKTQSNCTASVQATLASAISATVGTQSVFDPVQARACVDAIVALGDGALCASWFMSATPSLAACGRVVDGTLQPGAACNGVETCQRGALNGTNEGGYVGCLVYGTDTASRCRAFVPTTTVGAACESGDVPTSSDATVTICGSGLECTSDKTCATAPAIGAPCPTNVCAADAYCSMGACVALGSEGQDCSQVPCVRGYTCDATTNLCVAEPSVPWILDVGFDSTSYSCSP